MNKFEHEHEARLQSHLYELNRDHRRKCKIARDSGQLQPEESRELLNARYDWDAWCDRTVQIMPAQPDCFARVVSWNGEDNSCVVWDFPVLWLERDQSGRVHFVVGDSADGGCYAIRLEVDSTNESLVSQTVYDGKGRTLWRHEGRASRGAL
jgi:hypothetical protein